MEVLEFDIHSNADSDFDGPRACALESRTVRDAEETMIRGSGTNNQRWDALDVLRGLTIILMLMNLGPGSWEHNYAFLVHAKWEGGSLIDMVAPAFLFCIGVAMPLSFERRSRKGASRSELLGHVLTRGALLVALGFFLNLYPGFEFATVRIPSVLSRIGLCYLLSGIFMLGSARSDTNHGLRFSATPLAVAGIVILVSYWALLVFVPVPGFGPQRFDAVGSWPAYVDRAVIGVQHLFPYWPVDGKVVFDPEGILSTWPACFNVLFGAVVGILYKRGSLLMSAGAALVLGLLVMGVAWLLHPWCEIIKNIWTPTFALFSAGFALALLGLLMPVSELPGVRPLLWPARIFGENPLLAYILVFLVAPLVDANFFGSAQAPVSARSGGQAWLEQFAEPRAASLLFALAGILGIFIVLLVCHRRRWILKL